MRLRCGQRLGAWGLSWRTWSPGCRRRWGRVTATAAGLPGVMRPPTASMPPCGTATVSPPSTRVGASSPSSSRPPSPWARWPRSCLGSSEACAIRPIWFPSGVTGTANPCTSGTSGWLMTTAPPRASRRQGAPRPGRRTMPWPASNCPATHWPWRQPRAARERRSAQFREFLAWELRRSLALYARAMTLPAFAWPDRRLERTWRADDPFVMEELRALYGDALTVRDLLP